MDVDLDDLFDTEPARDGPTDEHAEPLFSDDDDAGDDGANENAEGENQDDAQKKADDAADPKPKKKRVSRPQPKLNGDRLCGPRGIGIMEEAFSDLKFAGRGHERRDLHLLMARMQHWAHRLFPKMPFDQTIQQIEKLGKTRQVKVNVRKLRMGMDVLPAEVGPEEDTTQRGEPERDVFDELIGDEPPRSPVPPSGPAASPPPSQQQQQSTAPSSLTEEQKERMRKNREAAQLRRMRAQFTRQQQQQAPESEQQTQPRPESDSVSAAAASESGSPQPRSPADPRPDPTSDGIPGSALSQAAGGGGDASGPVESDVEMEESVPRAPGVAADAGDEAEESVAPRLGALHQMSETAPGYSGATEEPMRGTENGDALTPTETSAGRLGHLHQMSETATVQLEADRETEPIVVPDETEAIVVPDETDPRPVPETNRPTEAIVVPDDADTEAIVIPDEDEDDVMMVSDEREAAAAMSHDSTEVTRPEDTVAEYDAPRAGHLHQMSETEAAADSAMDADAGGTALSDAACAAPGADAERAEGDGREST